MKFIKSVIPFLLISLLFACDTESAVTTTVIQPDYVGTWEKAIDSSTSYQLVLTSSTFTTYELIVSATTGAQVSKVKLEAGTIEEIDANTLEFISSGVYLSGEYNTVNALSQDQYTRNVTWEVSSDTIILDQADSISGTTTYGSFTKE